MKMEGKKGFDFSFAWLFAILVGAVIIFLAVYFAVKMVGTGTSYVNTVMAKQLSIIFEPLETGLLSGEKPAPVLLKEDTRIFNKCFPEGNFGKQQFSISTKSGFGKWNNPGAEINIPNKYVFSNSTEEGKKVYFFSKPFEMPFKVSEIIFLSMQNYCFVNAPEEIKDEVLGLGIENIILGNCSDEIKVCFGSGDCEIKVQGSCLNCESSYEYGFVSKNGKSMFYTGSLLYGAIFASPDVYECNVERLGKRLRQEALLLKDESGFLSGKCGAVSTSLVMLANTALINNSQQLLLVKNAADKVEIENEAAECKLWQ